MVNRPSTGRVAGRPGYKGRSTGHTADFVEISVFSLVLLLDDFLLGRMTWALPRSTGQARKVVGIGPQPFLVPTSFLWIG